MIEFILHNLLGFVKGHRRNLSYFRNISVYRAERHNSSRHLNEYIGLDFEMAYIDSMYEVMEMETGMGTLMPHGYSVV